MFEQRRLEQERAEQVRLGEVPDGWHVRPIKRIGKLRAGTGFPYTAQGSQGEELPFFKVSDMNSPRNSEWMVDASHSVSRSTARELGARVFPRGSIIFPKVGAALLTNKRRLLSAASCIDNNVMILVPSSGDCRYLLRLMEQVDLGLLANPGAVPSVSEGQVGEVRVALPSLSKQRSIADFLDRETAKIGRLIEEKERLIELLEEKRTVLITQAVTKGLDPDVEMKDSGVEWLGEIPAHWDPAPLYSRYEVALGKMLDSKRITGDYLAPYLRNVDIRWHRIHTEDLPRMDFGPSEQIRYRLEPGDLLVCEGGEVGRTAMWNGEIAECYYQKAIHRLRPYTDKDHPAYFAFVMEAGANLGVFTAGSNPNTIDHLTAVQLRRHRFPFPPKDEQVAIARVLDEEATKLRELRVTVEEAITLLREYRSALISAAVTGKIDVRKEAA